MAFHLSCDEDLLQALPKILRSPTHRIEHLTNYWGCRSPRSAWLPAGGCLFIACVGGVPQRLYSHATRLLLTMIVYCSVACVVLLKPLSGYLGIAGRFCGIRMGDYLWWVGRGLWW